MLYSHLRLLLALLGRGTSGGGEGSGTWSDKMIPRLWIRMRVLNVTCLNNVSIYIQIVRRHGEACMCSTFSRRYIFAKLSPSLGMWRYDHSSMTTFRQHILAPFPPPLLVVWRWFPFDGCFSDPLQIGYFYILFHTFSWRVPSRLRSLAV